MTTAPEIWGIYKRPARLQVNLLRSHTKRSTCKNKVYFYILAPTDWNRIISPRALRPLSPWVIPWKNSQDSAWVVLMSGIDYRGIMGKPLKHKGQDTGGVGRSPFEASVGSLPPGRGHTGHRPPSTANTQQHGWCFCLRKLKRDSMPKILTGGCSCA